MKVSRLHHLAIKAKNPERVAQFYQDVLGLEPIERHHDSDGLRSVWLQTEGTILMVERAGTEGLAPDFQQDPPGLHLVAFTIATEDGRRWRSRLADANLPVLHETDFTLYVADPEGNRVGLSTWPHQRD